MSVWRDFQRGTTIAVRYVTISIVNRRAVQAVLQGPPQEEETRGTFTLYHPPPRVTDQLVDLNRRQVMLGPLYIDALVVRAKEDPDFRNFITSDEGMQWY